MNSDIVNTTLPSSIKVGYFNCKVRPYIPKSLCCFKCQRKMDANDSSRVADIQKKSATLLQSFASNVLILVMKILPTQNPNTASSVKAIMLHTQNCV